LVRITRPYEATIIIDDERRQKIPPGDIRLHVGKHRLKVEETGFVREVHVSKDATIIVSLE
jgi:hypothetical protein